MSSLCGTLEITTAKLGSAACDRFLNIGTKSCCFLWHVGQLFPFDDMPAGLPAARRQRHTFHQRENVPKRQRAMRRTP